MNDQYSNSFSKQFREDQEEFLNIAIKKWKFHKNFKRNLIIFSLIGAFLLIFAIVFLVYNLSIVEVRHYYTNDCLNKNTECEFELDVPETMEPPIFVYYQLDNFYRKNRNFYRSRSVEQLRGQEDPDVSDCGEYTTNDQMKKTQSVSNQALDPSKAAFPCGEIAYTYFTDEFYLKDKDGLKIEIDETNIAWDSDKESNFKNPTDWQNKGWTNVQNEHFMVWMRTAGQGKLRKLWGRIHTKIPKGSIYLGINETYDVSKQESDVRKSFFMTTTTPFGQKNLVLVGAYFAGAFICLCSIVVLLVIYYRDKKKKII